jgi:hypothetical protein
MEPRDSGLQPRIGIVLDFAALVGFGAKMFNRASVADMGWRAIQDQTPRLVGSDRPQVRPGWTLPNIVPPVVSETRDAHLLGPMMRITRNQLETEGDKEKKHRVGARQEHFYVDGLLHLVVACSFYNLCEQYLFRLLGTWHYWHPVANAKPGQIEQRQHSAYDKKPSPGSRSHSSTGLAPPVMNWSVRASK